MMLPCSSRHGCPVPLASLHADVEHGSAVMLVTADSPVPQEVVDGIVSGDGFEAGRTVSL